jgi:hypothetical protein
MELSWLMQALFEAEFGDKELRTEFRRKGGRFLHLKVSEAKIPVDRLAKYCGKFLRLGFDFSSDVKAAIDSKFGEEPDISKCAQALTTLKETQVFSLDDYKGWYYKVGSRFKPEMLDEAMRAAPETRQLKLRGERRRTC